MGFRGHVDIEFTVERDGAVSEVRLLKSSGTPALDRAAQNALPSSRLLPLPADYAPRAHHDAGHLLLQRGAAELRRAHGRSAEPLAPACRPCAGRRRRGGPGRVGSCGSAPGAPGGPSLPAVQAATVTRPAARESLPEGVAAPAIRVGMLADVDRVSTSADAGVIVRAIAAGDQPSVFLPPPARWCAPRSWPRARRPRASACRWRAWPIPTARARRPRRAEAASGLRRSSAGTPRRARTRCGSAISRAREDAQAFTSRAARLDRGGGVRGHGQRAPAPARDRRGVRGGAWSCRRRGRALLADAAPYRGVLEVRATPNGALTVVNVLNLEDYLRGVVPNELSPAGFPQIEALKAQAVAARTYALRNRGQFPAQGLRHLRDAGLPGLPRPRHRAPALRPGRATRRGASWPPTRGTLINALYTSTCGGHTEDGENIFEGRADALPARRGLPAGARRPGPSLRTTAPAQSSGEPGLDRDVALLVALGVLDAGRTRPAALEGAADASRSCARWTARLVAAAAPQGLRQPARSRRARGAARSSATWCESLCWDERAQRLLAPGDADYLLQVEDRADAAASRRALAGGAADPGGRALAASRTTRCARARPHARARRCGCWRGPPRSVGPPALVSGEFRGASREASSRSKRGRDAETYPLDAGARLFRALDGSRRRASELSLAAGDKVRFVAARRAA